MYTYKINNKIIKQLKNKKDKTKQRYSKIKQ